MDKIKIQTTLVLTILAIGLFLQSANTPVQAGISSDSASIPGTLKDFQYISPDNGWVQVENQLYFTTDNGTSWKNITPTGNGLLRSALFLNENQGFVITTKYTNSYSQHKLGYTENSGQDWTFHNIVNYSVSSPNYYVEAVSPFFLNEQIGWVMLKIKTSSNFSVGKLFMTTNGGETWNSRSTPIGEPVYFIDQNIGFTSGGATKKELYRTTDGGITWNQITLESELNYISSPYFISQTQGFLPTFQNSDDSTELVLFSTSDTGQTWSPAYSTSLADQPDYFPPVSFTLDKLHTLSPAQILSIDLLTFTPQTTPTPPDQFLTKLKILPTGTGWAISSEVNCADPDNTSTCVTVTDLLNTNDHGQTWMKLQRPQVTTIVELPTITFEPRAAIILNDHTDWMVGQGFDMCEITKSYNFRTWKNNSPYNAVNLYIGGVSRACANVNLSQGLIETLSKQGWKFIPTWVGHQAACTGYNTTMSYGTTLAYNQGRDNAYDAAQVAWQLGLKNEYQDGTVIYYDLEAFNTNDAACLAAAKSFINGWVERLHEFGITAGVYGSVCASGLNEFYTLDNPPDVIWPALWTEDTYFSPITPDNLPCLSPGMWDNHERILQYTGTHTENWGEVSLYIDLNTIDGIVADTSKFIGVPTNTIQNPSFENGALSPWEISPNSTACNWTLSSNSDDARTGNYSLLLNKTETQTDCFGVKQNIPHTPTVGEKYRFAVWVRSTSSALRSARLSITGTGTNPETTSQKFSGIKNDWSCIEVDHTITQSGFTGLEIAFQVENSDGIDIHLDDAKLSVDTNSLCPAVSVPTNLKASYAALLDQVWLSWDETLEATYYRVFRASSPSGSPQQIGISETTEYSDLSLNPNETYTYWVQACTPYKCSTTSGYAIGSTAFTSLIFYDDFETNDLTHWSSFYDKQALETCSEGSILNNYGLCLYTVANETKYATHNLVTPSNDLNLNFWIDPNSASFDQITILQGKDNTTGNIQFQILLKRDGGYKIQYRIRENDNSWKQTYWHPIADAPNLIKITWNSTYIQARSTSDFSDTSLWINNNLTERLETNNFGQTLDQISLGIVTPPNSSNASHTIYIDEISYEGPKQLRPRE